MDARFEAHHFVEKGNGIMCCYNMFPTQFGSIANMTAYLPMVGAMGFNVVWVNPLQDATHVAMEKRDKKLGVRAGNTVIGSMYAMRNPSQISAYFSDAPHSPSGELLVSPEVAQQIDTRALQQFTQAARDNKLVPIFDLVLNHLAADAPLCRERPHWFAKGVHPDFQDARAFNYEDEVVRREIIEHLWKPYIRQYIQIYGFGGVRVDAVGYIHPEVRREIYQYLYDLAEELNIPKPVILDEVLFSGDTQKMSANLRLPGNIGPTHITTGAYYARREWHGGLPGWVNAEAADKASVVFQTQEGEIREHVKGGCINFSGNHDHNSLAMTVLHEMAEERLQQHERLHHLAEQLNAKYRSDEGRESIFLYSFVQDMEQAIANHDHATIHDFERRMREKIAMGALTSSGGWYALAGDETGDTTPKSVFHRQQALEQDYYPQRSHRIFLGEHKQAAKKALDTIARNFIQSYPLEIRAHMDEAYRSLTHDLEQERIIMAYVENLKNLVNSGDPAICQLLQDTLEEQGVTFNQSDYVAVPRQPSNGWNGRHDMREFMRETNSLLQQLPASQYGFSSEMIRLAGKPELAIVVRRNGPGYNAKTDLVIVNLTPDKPVTLDLEDITEIGVIYQKRIFSDSFNIDSSSAAATFYYVAKKSDIHLGSAIVPSDGLMQTQRVRQVKSTPALTATPGKLGVFGVIDTSGKLDQPQPPAVARERPVKGS
ncbi:MAG: hypothetical protein A3E83_02260 [Gammaproteobacteria bacterium RIFCSPHIGHO2_12_FULL_41_20]|nr:MAG: hypothetical protein A3E83_02260 [Gammaproteobacteria bacterium RIFCSPHIGHO2_12_FULL_41_20]